MLDLPRIHVLLGEFFGLPKKGLHREELGCESESHLRDVEQPLDVLVERIRALLQLHEGSDVRPSLCREPTAS